MEFVSFSFEEARRIAIAGICTYVAILLLTRIAGLRSFSKMSAADFAMTVAVGSLFASTVATGKPSVPAGVMAIATLFGGQWLIAWLRRHSRSVSKLVDNEPLLLMKGANILDDNLERANVTREDLFGKLREANALNYQQVLAVVFETTGDISVLHSSDPDARLEPEILSNVRGVEQLTGNSSLSDSSERRHDQDSG